MDTPSSSSRSAVNSAASRMNGDFISVGEALKLVPPFKGNKQDSSNDTGTARPRA